MSQLRLDGRTLGEAVLEAQMILEQAIQDHQPHQAVIGLFSGGKDSVVMMSVAHHYLTHAAHIDTGIAIPDAQKYVREWCELNQLPLIVKAPRERSYEELVLEHGFPGPAAHRFMYSWLKERPLRDIRRMFVKERGQRVMFVTGVRVHESQRRMGTAKEVDRDGSVVWVAPILHFTTDEMVAYRKLHDIRLSPVAENLGMSGECLCGSFARQPWELESIRVHYPEVYERIRELEQRVEAKGIPQCKWGVGTGTQRSGRLCSSCVGQEELEVPA